MLLKSSEWRLFKKSAFILKNISTVKATATPSEEKLTAVFATLKVAAFLRFHHSVGGGVIHTVTGAGPSYWGLSVLSHRRACRFPQDSSWPRLEPAKEKSALRWDRTDWHHRNTLWESHLSATVVSRWGGLPIMDRKYCSCDDRGLETAGKLHVGVSMRRMCLKTSNAPSPVTWGGRGMWRICPITGQAKRHCDQQGALSAHQEDTVQQHEWMKDRRTFTAV